MIENRPGAATAIGTAAVARAEPDGNTLLINGGRGALIYTPNVRKVNYDPLTNFESVVRMWRKMFERYALGPIPSEDEIREAVIEDHPRFQSKLATGKAGRFDVGKFWPGNGRADRV